MRIFPEYLATFEQKQIVKKSEKSGKDCCKPDSDANQWG